MNNPNKLGIGSLITEPQQRDAIHMAVIPMTAADLLLPGAKVGAEGMVNTVDPIGVVDPFLTNYVKPGEVFWLFLFPGTVTGLRHEWSHPAFPANLVLGGDVEESMKWLTEYVQRNCPYYARLDTNRGGLSKEKALEAFLGYVKSNEIYYYGRDLHSRAELDREDDLFHHLSVVLGRQFDRDSMSYSCSC